jgi:molybdopterin/thiamine biosynthesis adenylyltransferase
MQASDFETQRRYARHHILPGFGAEGQTRLAHAHVLVVGAGGLGSPALTYLASSGLGQITLVDDDRIDASNLPRQILFEPGDVGRAKVDAARDRLEELNPTLKLTTHAARFEDVLAAKPNLLAGVDVVLDGCDNFPTRLAVNAACVHAVVPLVSGAIIGWRGQLASFCGHKADHACYQCLVSAVPEQEDTCSTNGVIAPLGGIIGAQMALEAIRIIAQIEQPLFGRLLQLDAASMRWRESRVMKDPACGLCAASAACLKPSA